MRYRNLIVPLTLMSLCVTPASAQQSAAKPANRYTQQALAAFTHALPARDDQDFEFAARGFIATVPDGKLRNPDGHVVASVDSGALFKQPAPPTVNPSLWRNAQLLEKHGLFKVTDGIYQVRGFNISNMTIIVGKTGYIVVDPGYDAGTYAGMQLVYQHLGKKPVTGVIYTHSHSDHYSGVRSIISDEEVATRKVPVIAPEGFIKEILGEAVIAGPAMDRRSAYQFGAPLPLSATGNVNLGIGPQLQFFAAPASSTTERARLPIAPTREIGVAGDRFSVDGVRFEFQMAPNTEAPGELHFYLPDLKALCLAENANGSMHNALPARGALVRDTKNWASALTQAISLYGDRTDVLFTSHFWPRWGNATIVDYLGNHRDAYQYLHDQSIRMMNDGLTGPEIARAIKYPDALASKWYNREYYGTLSHNSRAVYQRYLGFYDGNPANLDPMTLTEGATHYVQAIGGAKRVLALANAAIAKDDYRWAVELLNKLVFAEPANAVARTTLADVYEQLGYRAESATWRNGYLTAATELRKGPMQPVRAAPFADLRDLPTDMFLDAIAVRLVPDRAKDRPMAFAITDPDTGRSALVQVRNSVMVHEAGAPKAGMPVLTLSAHQFYAAMTGAPPASLSANDGALVRQFAALFDGPLTNFPIVMP